MPASERSACPVEALSDRELEVLRLLTAGHTVKSIAVRLGRSEASINERLRDARRKTGAGSSRELARRLDAQKIWDRKIDLSAQHSATDEAAQAPILRRPTPKGTILMLVAMAVAAAAVVGVVFTAESALVESPQTADVAAPAPLPIVGRWSLDTARLPADERPRSVILDFRVSADRKWMGRSEIVAADGTRQHAETIAAADGVPVAVTGNMTFADRVSLRQPAPDTLVLTFTKQGVPISTRVYTVEADRQSMKETIIWAGDVTPRMVTTYFNRVG